MADQPLVGKVALVTGASRGLGKGIAIGLGEAGATIYVTGRSLAEPTPGAECTGSLIETCMAVKRAGGHCIPVEVDHSDDQQIQGLFERINREQKGQLDLLVNNAFGGVGVLSRSQNQPFWESSPDLWDACNHVGLRSHYIASVHAAALMAKRRQGLICTISSWGGISYIFGTAYGTGKAGCDRMAADMAVELKPYNVASISLWPGIVGTEQLLRLSSELADQPENQTAQAASLRNRYNWETPLLTGRVIAALAAEPKIMNQTGRIQIVAELAEKYQLVDTDGNSPASLRSLRFLLPFKFPQMRNYAALIPNLKIPWLLLLLRKSPL